MGREWWPDPLGRARGLATWTLRATHDRRVNEPAQRSERRIRRVLARARVETRLTGLAIWRGAVGFYNSDDLTFA